jgi:hypothetical protein
MNKATLTATAERVYPYGLTKAEFFALRIGRLDFSRTPSVAQADDLESLRIEIARFLGTDQSRIGLRPVRDPLKQFDVPEWEVLQNEVVIPSARVLLRARRYQFGLFKLITVTVPETPTRPNGRLKR